MTNTQLIAVWGINILSAVVAGWAMHQKGKLAAMLLEICQASDAAIETLSQSAGLNDTALSQKATSGDIKVLAAWHKARTNAGRLLAESKVLR